MEPRRDALLCVAAALAGAVTSIGGPDAERQQSRRFASWGLG